MQVTGNSVDDKRTNNGFQHDPALEHTVGCLPSYITLGDKKKNAGVMSPDTFFEKKIFRFATLR